MLVSRTGQLKRQDQQTPLHHGGRRPLWPHAERHPVAPSRSVLWHMNRQPPLLELAGFYQAGAAGGRIVRDVPMDRRPPAEIAVDLAAVAGTVPPLGQELADFVLPRRSLLVLTQRNVLRGLPYVPDAPLPAASMNGMLE